MPRPFWSNFNNIGQPDDAYCSNGPPKTLQDGLLQIGAQACHILVHRIDSAAAEAIRGHNRNGKSASFRSSRHRHFQTESTDSTDEGEQFVVLIPSPSVSIKNAATSRSTPESSEIRPPRNCAPEDDIEQWGSRFLLRSEEHLSMPNPKWNSKSWCKPSYIPISMILILIFLVVLLPLVDQGEQSKYSARSKSSSVCADSCSFTFVESIPEGLAFQPGDPIHPSTFSTWSNLINISESTIEIASLYWSLRGADVIPHPSAYQGEEILNQLINAGANRNIKLKIAQNTPSRGMPSTDTEDMAKKGIAEVRSLNFAKLIGNGVLHTKFWIVDRTHVYIGSANMDWRSLTQVKEMGAVIYNCSCLANDIGKIFDVYWELGKKDAVIPDKWPANYSTSFNKDTPMNVTLNGTSTEMYLSSSPPPFSPSGRSGDADAIVDIITQAEKFVYIAVMEYMPVMMYTPKTKFWPVIDNALRTAAIERKVNVRLLISNWQHRRKDELNFAKSLQDLSNSYDKLKIEVKLFTVPATPDQQRIPFARVNHNKYMVTDKTAYVGTSNWSGDYFTNTAGVGLVIQSPRVNKTLQPSPFRDELQAVFERDWFSQYSKNLSDFLVL